MAGTALARTQQALSNVRKRASAEIAKRDHTVFAVAGSTLLGMYEGRGNSLPSPLGMDPKLFWGTIGLVVADNVGGRAGRVVLSMSEGLLCVGGYNFGRAMSSGVRGIGAVDGGSGMEVDLLG